MIYDILNEQKKRGVGILFVGEDLDVMLALYKDNGYVSRKAYGCCQQ